MTTMYTTRPSQSRHPVLPSLSSQMEERNARDTGDTPRKCFWPFFWATQRNTSEFSTANRFRSQELILKFKSWVSAGVVELLPKSMDQFGPSKCARSDLAISRVGDGRGLPENILKNTEKHGRKAWQKGSRKYHEGFETRL